MLSNLRHLFRALRRSPASAAAAILTLALTLGTSASIFAIVDSVLLTPPPFADPDDLVVVGETPIGDDAAGSRTVSYATFEGWRERGESVATLEAFDGTNFTLTELGAAERISANDVTPGFLALLGVAPLRGRAFGPDDAGRPHILISEPFWRGKLGGDPAIIGRRIVLGGQPHTIVGVLTEDVSYVFGRADVWRPMPLMRDQEAKIGYRVRVIARLRPAVSSDDLTPALEDVSRTSRPPARVRVTSLVSFLAADSPRTLTLLAGAASLAVLIAFANLAGLLIVRSIDRRRELTVRTALGAHRSEAAKQLFLEAGVLVMTGTLGGLLIAFWATPVAGDIALAQFQALGNRNVSVSWRLITALAGLGFVCAVLCGLWPALQAARLQAVDVLRRGVTQTHRDLALRRAFVIGEIAVAFVLLTSMALLTRHWLRVTAIDPGFDARGVLALPVSLPAAAYDDQEVVLFYSTLQKALEERLGTSTVSIIDELPLTGYGRRRLVRRSANDQGREAVVRTATPGYFDVMRIPIVSGRSFGLEDTAQAPSRVIISASLSERLFGAEQPVGRRIRVVANGPESEVIGVAGDVKHGSLDESVTATVYTPATQDPSRTSIVVVRSSLQDADVIATVRSEVARLDRDVPVYGNRSMQEIVDRSPGVPARRLMTTAFAAFALLGVVLSAIGLFGVAAHDVASRRPEFALRIALGAEPRRILNATLGRGALMVGLGLVAGSVLSLAAAMRGFSGLIATGGHPDVFSVGLAAAVLVATGVGAVLPAALRAARTDPAIALRGD